MAKPKKTDKKVIKSDEEIDDNYELWCKKIAKSRDLSELISHFREHVGEHYDRYDRNNRISFNHWLAGVFNFLYILEKKCPDVMKKDMLFKLCTYYKNHGDGPNAPFDVDEFMEKYDGEIRETHKLD